MFARTGRLMLRPAWPEDAASIAAAAQDAAITASLCHISGAAMPPCGQNDEAAENDPRLPQLLLFRRTAGAPRLIGGCGLARYDGEATLGCWIARSYWGLGYATEAINALIEIAVTLGHDRLAAYQIGRNDAYARLLAKTGFNATRVVTRMRIDGEIVEARRYFLELDEHDIAQVDPWRPQTALPYDAHNVAA